MVKSLILRLLREVSLGFDDGTPVPPQLLQPRKLALLAFLGVEDRAVGRGEIVGILWSDASEARARGSLSQLIHTIRRDCPIDPFLSEGSFLRLHPERVACDLAIFFKDVERFPLAEFLGHGRLSCMPGLAVPGETVFEEWCSEQRRRFELAFADAAWVAAQRCSTPHEALKYLDTVALMRPFDEAVLRKRMRLLRDSGKSAAAISLYQDFRKHLHEELGASPAGDTRAVADELRNTGTHGAPQSSQISVSPSPSASSIAPTDYSARRRWLPLTRLLVGLLLVAGVATGVLLSRPVLGDRGVPVVGIGNLQFAGGEWERRTRLMSDLAVLLAEDTTFAFMLADHRQSTFLLAGTVNLKNNGMEGTVLVTAPNGDVSATLHVQYPSASDAQAIRDLARRIRETISTQSALDDHSRRTIEFQELLSVANKHRANGAYDLAEETLRLIEHEVARTTLPPTAKQRIASSMWEARAWNALAQNNRAQALRFFNRAISAHPAASDADARRRLADLYYFAGAVDPSGHQAYFDQARRTIEQIPPNRRDSAAWTRLAAVLYELGRYAEAYSSADVARLKAGPSPQLALLLFQSAFNMRKDPTAAAECRQIRRDMPRTWPAVACAAMLVGWTRSMPYMPLDLTTEMEDLDEPDPVRLSLRHKLALLVAASAARVADIRLADSLAAAAPLEAPDYDLQAFRAAYLIARGRQQEADAVVTKLSESPRGARAVRGYRRLLDIE